MAKGQWKQGQNKELTGVNGTCCAAHLWRLTAQFSSVFSAVIKFRSVALKVNNTILWQSHLLIKISNFSLLLFAIPSYTLGMHDIGFLSETNMLMFSNSFWLIANLCTYFFHLIAVNIKSLLLYCYPFSCCDGPLTDADIKYNAFAKCTHWANTDSCACFFLYLKN